MDPEEIKKDLKKLLELVSKRASEDDVGTSRRPAVHHYPDAATVLDDKNSPSAHAILAMQEIGKSSRESVGSDYSEISVDKKESPLEKFTDLIMAVTAHDEYNKLDEDEQLQNVKSFHSIVPNKEQSEDEKSVRSIESSLEKFMDVIMAVTKHDVYNENDDDDFIKTAPLPREDSTTTLKAHSNENLNDEIENIEVLEHVHDLSSEVSIVSEKHDSEVELEVELQVKVKSDADLVAIAEALKNITFISTRVTESTPKEPINYPEISSSLKNDLMHESAVPITSESDCLECALYSFEKSEEVRESKPVENFSQEMDPNETHEAIFQKDANEIGSNEEENFENFVEETEKMSPYESDERLSPVTTHASVVINQMSTLVKPSEEDPKNEIEINKSDLHVDSVADALKNVEFTPSNVTINAHKDENESDENLSPENDSKSQSTLIKNSVVSSDEKMFDITSSVVPEKVSTISFRHEVYDSQATFSMQPEKIELKPNRADFLFGQSNVPVERKQRHDCNCELKTKQKQKDFEEVMKRTAEAIERIERESQELNETTSVEETMKNVEENLENELKASVKSVMSRVDLRTFSKTVVDEMKNAMSSDHRMCQCEARREKRKKELDEIYESEEREYNLNLPVTSMMKSLIFKNVAQNESREDTESHDEIDETIVQVETLDDDPILKRLREIIFGGASSDVDDDIPEKFSKVQFKFTNPKTLNRTSQYFKSCLDSNEIIYRTKPETSDIKQKIQEFENLSAKSSAVSIKPTKSQTSLIAMNVECCQLPKAQVEEELRKCVCFEAKKEPQESLIKPPVEEEIKKVECCLSRKKNVEEEVQKDENKCCILKKANRNEEPKLVLNTPDIEDLPSKGKLKRISKTKMATLSEEKELNTFYNRVLMMDDESTSKKIPKLKVEDKPDDDGFSTLPNVPSNNLSEVASSAWIDENISFIVNDQEERKNSNRVSLGFGYPREDQRHSRQKEEEHEKECSPSTSNESTPSKFTSRLRQCKCLMQRISKSILGKKK